MCENNNYCGTFAMLIPKVMYKIYFGNRFIALCSSVSETDNVSEEQKDFLIKAAQRHLGFNYSKIAEYYAHTDKKTQELMEELVLVIIDFNDAVKQGFVEYSEMMKNIIEKHYGEEFNEIR